ncbi:MAG: gamma-glutamyltransferase [Chloroflexota bacterium]|nr:gamma-glutamyltransferase [Chloroflexota bacterium]
MTLVSSTRHGAIAAGHPLTVAAGAQILEQGGNAVDAAVAAAFASFVAEYTVSATGGAGFALIYDARRGDGTLYDFFSAAPGLGRKEIPAPEEIDFRKITIDYGDSQQDFYVGRGSVGVPGNIAGLCMLSRDKGRLPLTVLLEPAIQLAREGVQVTEMQYFISLMLEPIFLSTPGSAAIFGRSNGAGGLLEPGELLRMCDLADSLEALGKEGPRLFYEGEIARALWQDQAENGGLITAKDMSRYRVRRRLPLVTHFRNRTVLTNPPPSRGGLLISFSLNLLKDFHFEQKHHGTICHLELIAEVMRVTNLARGEMEQLNLLPRQQIGRMLGPATVNRWAETLRDMLRLPIPERPTDQVINARSSTTQISVIDQDGLAVSMTTSGGEGAGYIVPGTGIVPNNMMGEEDLHPQGFHQMMAGRRIPSMMSPSVVLEDGWPVLAIGSGGANRIRSAILQVLMNVFEFDLDLEQAVEAPRVHWEEGILQVEGGNDPVVVAELAASGYNVNIWASKHMFFGGTHVVARCPDGQYLGVGDSRRDGCAQVV